MWPDTKATNEYYGGNKVAATKVYFTNGSQDPWQHAGVVHSLSDTEPAHVIKCHNCCMFFGGISGVWIIRVVGHCVDVRECPGGCDTPNDLDETRSQIQNYVASWLSS